MQKDASSNQPDKKTFFIYKYSFVFLLCAIFVIIFTTIFFIWNNTAIQSTKSMNPDVLKYFLNYWKFSWILVWFISFIILSILFLFRNILWLAKFRIISPIIYSSVFKTWALIWYFLLYREPRNTEIAIAIIDFFARPLFYSWLVLACFSWIWFFVILIKLILKK